jgi:hypothetical protein
MMSLFGTVIKGQRTKFSVDLIRINPVQKRILEVSIVPYRLSYLIISSNRWVFGFVAY